MTPEAKAIELLEKYREPTKQWHEIKGEWKEDLDIAKQCAIIAVDEIIASRPLDVIEREYAYFEITDDRIEEAIEYWQQVKEEINKL